MRLTAKQILEAKDLVTETVPVPEWPGTDGEPGDVVIKQMSAREIMAFQAEMQKPENKERGMFIVLARTAVDEAGVLLFTDADIEALTEKNLGVLDRLQRVALRINKMLPENAAALKKDSSEAAPAASPIA